MTGHEYAALIARYLVAAYGGRGIEVYREVALGKSIIGKNRSIDVLAVNSLTGQAFAVECKYQATSGTVDEKIPYALADIDAMWIPGVVVWDGEGFSDGVVQMLRGSKRAAWCRPDPNKLEPSSDTRELDHIIASVFGWWDIVLRGKSPQPL
jgi:hypothetical protein